MLNFTYLLDPGEDSRELLANVDYYALLFLLSDQQEQLAQAAVGAQWRATNKAVCWIIQRKHLEVAAPGSVLRRLNDAVRTSRGGASGDHTFLAWIRRSDFAEGKMDQGHIVQLELSWYADSDQAQAALSAQVDAAIGHLQERPLPERLRDIAPAAGALIAAIVKIFS